MRRGRRGRRTIDADARECQILETGHRCCRMHDRFPPPEPSMPMGRNRRISSRLGALALIATLGDTRLLAAQQPEIIRSTAPAAWGNRLRLVEEVRIGKLDGSDEYLFGSIEGVAVGRDGMIHVAD